MLIFAAILSATLSAQSLPLVPLQIGNPDQLARGLRDKQPIPSGDCNALNLWECHPDDPDRITDISIRWVQLDDDPELETILVTQAPAEDRYAAYIFDKQGSWNLVGSFWDRKWSTDGQRLVRVQQLTKDSPTLLFVTRDLGGSGSSILTTEAFQLRGGKLWPVMTITDQEEATLPAPGERLQQQVFSSDNRLVIFSSRERPPGRLIERKCEVRRWDASMHAFVPAASEQAEYCDPKTGKPIEGKSSRAGLPLFP